jgi:TolB-like protein/tetratricopeptide (TPR) repeat protein
VTDAPAEREGESTWTKLRRRKVVQWGLVYVAGAWGFLQGLEYVANSFHWPDQVRQIAILALAVGLPIVLVLAWYHGDRGEQRVGRAELTVIIILLLVGGAMLWRYARVIESPEDVRAATVQQTSPSTAPSEASRVPDEQSIAVLPFTNVTGDPRQEIVADGLAEEVANQLAAIPELRVTGRRSSFSFKGKNEDLRVIAEKLGVSNLLEGSLRAVGTRLRVTVQLIDGSDGTRRWSSRPYEHEQSGILAAQDEIAQDVARALSVTLDVGPLKRAHGGTRNLEAARRYWEFRELMLSDRRALELERRKVRLMRDAVRLDPQFVAAWDALAKSLVNLASYVGDTQPEQAEQLRAEAEQAWGRVAELAPDSWIALRKRSDDLLRAEKWAESEAVARQILESGPFTLERAQPLVNVLGAIGGYDEMIELQAQVIALEPRVMFPSRDQQWNLYMAGRFEESEAEYQRSQTLDGSHSDPTFLALLRGLARQDADPRALRELFQGAWSEAETPPQWWHDFGSAIPNRQGMLAVLRKAFEAGEDWAFTLADALGDRDLALTMLRTFLTHSRGGTGTWWNPWMLVHSGARADPRFKELMREAGLADYWRKSGKWPDFCGPVGDDDFECH